MQKQSLFVISSQSKSKDPISMIISTYSVENVIIHSLEKSNVPFYAETMERI